MNKKERNNYLLERLSETLHESICLQYANQFTSSWEFFGMLWRRVQEQEWFSDFISKNGYYEWIESDDGPEYTVQLDIELIDPDKFADKLYEYLKDLKL